MNEASIEGLLMTLPASFRSVLAAIEQNGLGIVFIVAGDRRLVGSITDGDIRRALLSGAVVEDQVTLSSAIHNPAPHALPFDCSIREIWSLLERGYRCIPLLDGTGRVVDVATRSRARRFPVAEPELGEQELTNVIECVTSGWISSQGQFIGQFEKAFAEYLGGGHALAVSNGTVALHLGMVALGIGPSDEVIVPDFTFGASVNTIMHAGATPVLVDIERDTWTIDVERVRAAITPRTRAIMPVHIYGQPARLDELREIAAERSLLIVEDCAESLGAEYKKRRVGLDGDCACFSFFANKVITTGEGGMLVFRDAEMAAHARVLRDHGMAPGRRYWHEYPGFNYRMTNLQAAIGVAQMRRIESLRARRRKLFDEYDRMFSAHESLSLLPRNDWSENSYWLYTLVAEGISEAGRDHLIKRLALRGVDTRPGFYPMHVMKPYAAFARGVFPVATHVASHSISLPSSPGLSESDVKHIGDVFLDELRQLGVQAA